jgi:hypothetical protein
MAAFIFTASGQAHGFKRSLVAGALLAAALTGAACARPASLDLSLNRPTEHDLFRVQLASGSSPIPLSRIHQFSLHVAGADGRPVTGATVKVDGGMPEHGQGLPTAPRADPAGSPGDYIIKGMKFSMTGWWVLKLDVAAPDGRHDKITFNIVL